MSSTQFVLSLCLVPFVALPARESWPYLVASPVFNRGYMQFLNRAYQAVLAQLSGWIEDYNTRASHSALGMRSPADYRAAATLSSSR